MKKLEEVSKYIDPVDWGLEFSTVCQHRRLANGQPDIRNSEKRLEAPRVPTSPSFKGAERTEVLKLTAIPGPPPSL